MPSTAHHHEPPRRRLAAPVLAVLVGLAPLLAGSSTSMAWAPAGPGPGQARGERPGVGRTAPEITGADLDGVPFALSDYRGKVVLIEFWGAWCPTCFREFPQLKQLHERFSGREFVILGVASGPLDSNREAARREQLPWRSWWDGGTSDGPIATAWRVESWPTKFLLDAHGVVRASRLKIHEAAGAIEELLQEIEADR